MSILSAGEIAYKIAFLNQTSSVDNSSYSVQIGAIIILSYSIVKSTATNSFFTKKSVEELMNEKVNQQNNKRL